MHGPPIRKKPQWDAARGRTAGQECTFGRFAPRKLRERLEQKAEEQLLPFPLLMVPAATELLIKVVS